MNDDYFIAIYIFMLGLTLIVSVGVSDYLATSVSAGIRVIIHDQKQAIFPDSTGFSINPGSDVAISLTTV